jgi:hypothetical protein
VGKGGRPHALGVERDADHARAKRLKRIQRAGVGRTLDDDRVAGPQQGARQQVDRLLRAAGDHDLVGIGGDTLLAKVLRQHAPQGRIPLASLVLERRRALLAQHLGHQLAELAVGEEAHVATRPAEHDRPVALRYALGLAQHQRAYRVRRAPRPALPAR